jgi:predicted dehydrogenase
MSMRCRYGHGGRPGYDKEWRSDPAVSGGGELLDQGIHAVDLFRWFAGDFSQAVGFTECYVWTAGSIVEDNGFALFRTAAGQVASLHASWTQWKNLFSFEIFGREGYLSVEGLGGSYGPESLVWGRRRPASGPPDEERFDFDGPDCSWMAEWQDLVTAIHEGRQPLATAYDGREAMRMVSAVYESAEAGLVVQW